MKSSLSLCLVIITFNIISCARDNTVNHEKKVYKQVAGHELKVDIFNTMNTKKNDLNPAIAFFHGGGWAAGDPSEFFGACERYAAKGFVTFSFQYRLSTNADESSPHPEITPVECVKDARSAIRWLRENAESLQIDPDKIVVGGQSGGGHLTLATALFDEINEDTDNLDISTTPNAMLLYSSCYNTMEAWVDMLLGDRREEIWSISPYHNLKEGLPPTLGFHSRDDCIVLFYSVSRFQRKMKELGNPFELVVLEGVGHYLDEDNEKYSRLFSEEIMERTDVFLESIGLMP